MSAKRSRKRFKNVSQEWDHYVGDRVTFLEYAARGRPFLPQLRRDLEEWWGNHPDPGQRLTPDEIEDVAQRLAKVLKGYFEPITPSETLEQFRDEWLAIAEDAMPADHPRGAQMQGSEMTPGDEDVDD